jgi:hypothetical protein
VRIIQNRRLDRVLVEMLPEDNKETELVSEFDARPTRLPSLFDTAHKWSAPRVWSVPIGVYRTKARTITALKGAFPKLQGADSAKKIVRTATPRRASRPAQRG